MNAQSQINRGSVKLNEPRDILRRKESELKTWSPSLRFYAALLIMIYIHISCKLYRSFLALMNIGKKMSTFDGFACKFFHSVEHDEV
jgi:hypothetical protein